jgi:uncharacterized protein DUF1569
MRDFDQEFIADAKRRLASLAPDTKSAWGSMTAGQMVGHITKAVEYSQGKGPEGPNVGGFFGRYIAAPLILSGLLRMPKNAQAPKEMYDGADPNGSVDGLIEALQEFYNMARAQTLATRPHVYFGDIGVRGWSKLHVLHVEHHFTQFGV